MMPPKRLLRDLRQDQFNFNFRPDTYWLPASASGGADAEADPSLDWGDYLPSLMSDEVEIARIVVPSTDMDVISIRARREDYRITYRIVDEYMEQGEDRFEVVPRSSVQPLTLSQLIAMIDENKLITQHMEEWLEGGLELEAIVRATVYSPFYSELGTWYRERSEAWLVEQENRRREEEIQDGITVIDAERLEDERNNALLPFKSQIDAFISSWSAENPCPRGTNVGIGWRMRLGCLRQYLEHYCLENGSMPVGRHEIECNTPRINISVDFP